MNSPVEERLRQALTEAGASIEPGTLRPLRSAERRRRRVDARWLAVAAAVVVAAGVSAVILIDPAGEKNTAASLVRDSESRMPEASIFLCGDKSALTSCKKRSTQVQRDAIHKKLLDAAEVESVIFEDQKTAFKNFQASGLSATLKKATRVEDMPESFRVRFKPGVMATALLRKIKTMPGVAQVVDHKPQISGWSAGIPEGWPEDRVVSIFLCRDGSPMPSCGAVPPAQRGTGATPDQIKTVESLIKSLPGVEVVEFVDQASAYEPYKDGYAKAGLRAEDMPETFRVLLRWDADHQRILTAAKAQPGVESAVDQRCLMESSC